MKLYVLIKCPLKQGAWNNYCDDFELELGEPQVLGIYKKITDIPIDDEWEKEFLLDENEYYNNEYALFIREAKVNFEN